MGIKPLSELQHSLKDGFKEALASQDALDVRDAPITCVHYILHKHALLRMYSL